MNLTYIQFVILAMVASLGARAESVPTDSTVTESVSVAEVTPAPKETAKPKAKPSATPAKKVSKSRVSVAAPTEPRANVPTKFAFDETSNLLVANHKYLVKYEDEESYGRVAANTTNSAAITFSNEDVAHYRDSIQKIAEYRSHMRNHCLGASAKYLTQALDKYFTSLASFNRRALPLVADISENNNVLVLVVNRTTLIDAPILISRYLQFKKQRFKESMNRFLPSDNTLVASMVNIAKVLHVEISEEDWNKTYGVRDNALELISAWPRETIFDATEKLTDTKETACIIEPTSKTQARNVISEPLPQAE